MGRKQGELRGCGSPRDSCLNGPTREPTASSRSPQNLQNVLQYSGSEVRVLANADCKKAPPLRLQREAKFCTAAFHKWLWLRRGAEKADVGAEMPVAVQPSRWVAFRQAAWKATCREIWPRMPLICRVIRVGDQPDFSATFDGKSSVENAKTKSAARPDESSIFEAFGTAGRNH